MSDYVQGVHALVTKEDKEKIQRLADYEGVSLMEMVRRLIRREYAKKEALIDALIAERRN